MFAKQEMIILFGVTIKELITGSLIDDYAKDGGEELFTKMHCVL